MINFIEKPLFKIYDYFENWFYIIRNYYYGNKKIKEINNYFEKRKKIKNNLNKKKLKYDFHFSGDERKDIMSSALHIRWNILNVETMEMIIERFGHLDYVIDHILIEQDFDFDFLLKHADKFDNIELIYKNPRKFDFLNSKKFQNLIILKKIMS